MMMDAQAEGVVVYGSCNYTPYIITMSGAPRKQEKDYSEEVKALQPQAEELAKVSSRIHVIEADN
jgi:hypothetical protein